MIPVYGGHFRFWNGCGPVRSCCSIGALCFEEPYNPVFDRFSDDVFFPPGCYSVTMESHGQSIVKKIPVLR